MRPEPTTIIRESIATQQATITADIIEDLRELDINEGAVDNRNELIEVNDYLIDSKKTEEEIDEVENDDIKRI